MLLLTFMSLTIRRWVKNRFLITQLLLIQLVGKRIHKHPDELDVNSTKLTKVEIKVLCTQDLSLSNH